MTFQTKKRVTLQVTLSNEEYLVIDKAFKEAGLFLEYVNTLTSGLLQTFSHRIVKSSLYTEEAKALINEIVNKAIAIEADDIQLR